MHHVSSIIGVIKSIAHGHDIEPKRKVVANDFQMTM